MEAPIALNSVNLSRRGFPRAKNVHSQSISRPSPTTKSASKERELSYLELTGQKAKYVTNVPTISRWSKHNSQSEKQLPFGNIIRDKMLRREKNKGEYNVLLKERVNKLREKMDIHINEERKRIRDIKSATSTVVDLNEAAIMSLEHHKLLKDSPKNSQMKKVEPMVIYSKYKTRSYYRCKQKGNYSGNRKTPNINTENVLTHNRSNASASVVNLLSPVSPHPLDESKYNGDIRLSRGDESVSGMHYINLNNMEEEEEVKINRSLFPQRCLNSPLFMYSRGLLREQDDSPSAHTKGGVLRIPLTGVKRKLIVALKENVKSEGAHRVMDGRGREEMGRTSSCLGLTTTPAPYGNLLTGLSDSPAALTSPATPKPAMNMTSSVTSYVTPAPGPHVPHIPHSRKLKAGILVTSARSSPSPLLDPKLNTQYPMLATLASPNNKHHVDTKNSMHRGGGISNPHYTTTIPNIAKLTLNKGKEKQHHITTINSTPLNNYIKKYKDQMKTTITFGNDRVLSKNLDKAVKLKLLYRQLQDDSSIYIFIYHNL